MVILPEGTKKEKKFYSIYDDKGKVIESQINRIEWRKKDRKEN